MSNIKIIPIFIPHKGCQNECVFCNQKAISGQVNDIDKKDIEKLIIEYSKTVPINTILDVAFYGGSFTGIDIDRQKEYLETVEKFVEKGIINGIRLSTRPDYINESVMDLLSEYSIKLIELGVQSMNDYVLKLSNRGHLSSDVYKAVKMIKSYSIEYGIQTMIGLPGDNREFALRTAKEVIDLKPSTIRIYPTLIIKYTELENLFINGLYVPLSLDEAVELSKDIYKLYKQNDINVIRIGLQPTENIKEGFDLIAGPFHPAFRQLVEGRLYLERIENIIRVNKLEKNKEICIEVYYKNVSIIVGNKKENIIFLKNKYNYKNIFISKNFNNCSYLNIS